MSAAYRELIECMEFLDVLRVERLRPDGLAMMTPLVYRAFVGCRLSIGAY